MRVRTIVGYMPMTHDELHATAESALELKANKDVVGLFIIIMKLFKHIEAMSR